MNEEERKQKIFKLIDDKNDAFMQSKNHLNSVANTIKELNDYIDKNVALSDEDITERLNVLVQYRVVLDIPIPIDTLLLRAVQIDDGIKYPPRYGNASRISYIPDDISYKAKLGRFNKDNEPMYYGAISKSIHNANVAFAEINAEENEYVNILSSKTSQELKVSYIGLLDYYKRDMELPFPVHPLFKEVYEYYKKTHDEELLMAIEECDRFFNDITTRERSGNLYEVTSSLSAIFLKSESVDGLIYESVDTKNAPNLVLKPKSVDDKVKHKEARIILIKEKYKDSLYHGRDFNKRGIIIDNKDTIEWKIVE